jgi:hypothetical protein
MTNERLDQGARLSMPNVYLGVCSEINLTREQKDKLTLAASNDEVLISTAKATLEDMLALLMPLEPPCKSGIFQVVKSNLVGRFVDQSITRIVRYGDAGQVSGLRYGPACEVSGRPDAIDETHAICFCCTTSKTCNLLSALVRKGGRPLELLSCRPSAEIGTSAFPTATSLDPSGEMAASTIRYGPVRHVYLTSPSRSCHDNETSRKLQETSTHPEIQLRIHAC